MITVFTDGACSRNPGPGGWAYIVKTDSGEETRASGHNLWTTNNQMELAAVIAGLGHVALMAAGDTTPVRVVTDSAYVAHGISRWMLSWKANGWMRKEGHRLKPVKNVEQWQLLDHLLAFLRVELELIKGHSGHVENEECDRMAVAEYRNLASVK